MVLSIQLSIQLLSLTPMSAPGRYETFRYETECTLSKKSPMAGAAGLNAWLTAKAKTWLE
jgi:hypothetical protein